MSTEQVAETKGVTVQLLASVDLGPEIEGMAGRRLRMRMVTIEPGGVFGPVHDHQGRPGTVYILPGNDHRPSQRGRYRLWAGSGLARGSEHDPLARERGNDSGGGDLGRYRRDGLGRGPDALLPRRQARRDGPELTMSSCGCSGDRARQTDQTPVSTRPSISGPMSRKKIASSDRLVRLATSRAIFHGSPSVRRNRLRSRPGHMKRARC